MESQKYYVREVTFELELEGGATSLVERQRKWGAKVDSWNNVQTAQETEFSVA